ncbi:hypothetical protein [Candidatus Enterovibrio escicola]|nr:hypothetical protein [Candidatus Enterovibrio escacola]
MSINNLDAVFLDVDDFCQTFLLSWDKHLIFFWCPTKKQAFLTPS